MGWPSISANANAGGPLAVKPRACALWAATLLERAEFHCEHGDTLLSVDCADKAICVLEELLFGARRLKIAVSAASATDPAEAKAVCGVGQHAVLSLSASAGDDHMQVEDHPKDEDERAPNSRSLKRNKRRREAAKKAKILLNEVQSQEAQDVEAEQQEERSSEQSTTTESELGQTELSHVSDQQLEVERYSSGSTTVELEDDVSSDRSGSQEEFNVEFSKEDEDAVPFGIENQNRGVMTAKNEDLHASPLPELTKELLEEVAIGCNQTCSESWKSQQFTSDKGLTWKKAHGRIAGESPAEVAGLQYYEAIEDDWLMLGHGVSSEMMLVKESPLVKKAQRWVRCWCNLNSGHHHDCSIYIPAVDDPDYVACGVVFLFNKGCWDWYEPPEDMPVGVVHKSIVTNATESLDLWSYEGTYDVKLKHVMRMGTAWPDFATLLSRPLPALEIHPRFTQSLVPLYPSIPIRVFNTFIHVPDEQDGDFEMMRVKKGKRAVRSWPCTPCATPKDEIKAKAEVKLPELGSEDLPTLGSAGHYKGTCKPCAFVRHGCKNGISCRFCHLCVPRDKKRGRWNLKRGRRKEELVKELEEYSPDA